MIQPSEMLGYSFNLFPGETVAQVRRAVDEFAVPLKRRVSPDATLGLELRFGLEAIRELRGEGGDGGALAGLRDHLGERGLVAFTLNGFPIGDFHRTRVKEDVFRPTWLEPERLEATRRLGSLAAGLLGEIDEGSVSTTPGTFKGWGHDEGVREAVVRAMARVAASYARLADEMGKTVRLCVEPEPLGTFENLEEVLDLFRLAAAAGADEVRRTSGVSLERAREILHEHLCLNYDTCHFSVQFEDPGEALRRLRQAGIRVAKMHLSSGLVVERPAENREGMAFLAELDEPRYLHQVVGVDRAGHVVLREMDLAGVLGRAPADLEPLRELRVHFHLPLFFEGGAGCRTTRDETARAYRLARSGGGEGAAEETRVFAIETYTWEILRAKGWLGGGGGGEGGLVDGLAKEIRWVLARRRE